MHYFFFNQHRTSITAEDESYSVTKQLCNVLFYFHWPLGRSDTFYQFIQTLLGKNINCIFRGFSLMPVNMASAYLTNEY